MLGLLNGNNDEDSQFTTRSNGDDASPSINSSSTLEDKVYLPIKSENSLIIILGILGMALLVSLFGNIFQLFNNRALAQRESVYVQQADGTTVKASEFDVFHREADVIKQTAVRWMQMTFEWDNLIPGSNAEDPGYEIEGTTRSIPTEVYLASYLMQDGFRQEFLRILGEQKIPTGVMLGRDKSVVRFFAISDPRQVGEGLWEVDIVATRIERDRNQETNEVPMNRTITLQAIPPIEPVFADA